jgi:L-ascorbate metabolism protein UlaG (beta-lactamase superfamily)
MRVRWYGQSAYLLTAGGRSVLIDPIQPNLGFPLPAMGTVACDLLLVTHEHGDHNGVEVAAGSPFTVRSTAGTYDTPLGRVVAVNSEHDDVAGTKRGPNAIMVFELGGVRVCHLGDLGQQALRPEQAAAIGQVDLLIAPVGGGPTIDGTQAKRLGQELGARWVVPCHYDTGGLSFLQPVDGFLALYPAAQVRRLEGSAFQTDDLPGSLVVVPAAPRP